MPHTLDENQIIKGVTMNIDFVEFEDKTSLGENSGGASLISEIRNGAMKYRIWVSKKYKDINKSDSEINTILKDKSFLQDSEFNNLTPNQSQGVRLFRIFLQKTYEMKGKPALEKCLSN
jgi:ribosomal protein S8